MSTTSRDELAKIDERQFLGLCMHDGDIVALAAEVFAREAPKTVHAVERALAREDCAGAARAIHQLKGSLLSVAAGGAATCAAAIEKRLRESGDRVFAAGQLGRLRAALPEVVAQLFALSLAKAG